ncbi:MAG: substrate-binding domain-containing protein [Akkermansiaceae bacterium]|nr:substrate-binding domain-containing protein [Akkermansiaceae bacterium]
MPALTILSPSEQVAEYLRGELLRGRWTGTLPGAPKLSAELGVDHKTVASALERLEKVGLLVGQGPGRPRRIVPPKDLAPPALRVAILTYEPLSEAGDRVFMIRQRLSDQGHTTFFAGKSQMELGFEIGKLARLVKETPADAWIVFAGSRGVLEWFAAREAPVFALFGRRRGLPIAGAGPDHVGAGRAAVRRLIELGHRRIVVLVRESQRAGGPGAAERAMFQVMEEHGLYTGPYNLPVWKDNPGDFRRMLDELFRVTPPTALIIDEPFIFHAAKDHLARRGFFAPDSLSLISVEDDPIFAWSHPSVAHISWSIDLVERRMMRWASNVAHGKHDRRQTVTDAEFVEGGTVGRAP